MSTVPKVSTGRFRSTTEEVVKPVERDAQPRHGIGVCLSGGGYRATLFHIGAARRLHELGILNRVDTISSVSGGSIFAAVLADLAMRRDWQDGLAIDDYERQVAEPARALTGHDVRTLPFLSTWPYNWLLPGPRAHLLQYMLARHLAPARLRDLPKQPTFAICATDLTFGVSWVSSRENTGSYEAGYPEEASEWPLAWAVAASACFPPFFGPLPLGSRLLRFTPQGNGEPGGSKLRRRIGLSDGGVYDNMGLEPVWKTRAYVFVSDAGAPFRFRSSRTPWGRILRYSSVVMRQSHSLRLRMFFDQLYGDWYEGAFWDIGSGKDKVMTVGYSKDIIDRRIARVRTDLDRFTPAEQRILENHGYWSVEQQVRKDKVRDGLRKILPAHVPKAVAPHPKWMDEDRVDHALRHSHRRFWPPRMLHGG